MKLKTLKIIIFLNVLTSAFITISCRSLYSNNLISGIIVDENLRPLSEVYISVNEKYCILSDYNGYFSVNYKKNTLLTFRKDSYIYEDEFCVCEGPGFLYIKMVSKESLILEICGLIKSCEKDSFDRAEKLCDVFYRSNQDVNMALYLKACLYKKSENIELFDPLYARLILIPSYKKYAELLKEEAGVN